MTVSTATSRVEYAGDGSTTAFAINFPYQAKSHIVATLINDSTEAETAWALTTNYTLTDPGATGTLTANVAPASGYTLRIERTVPLTQTTDYTANDAFPAETHETALDKLVMIDQQLQRQIDDLSVVGGLDGSDGASFLSGIGAPSTATGSDGDSYVDVTDGGDGTVYRKTSGSWADTGGSLRGPAGASGSGSGDLVSTNNLSDVASASTSRSNLGLAIGSDVQAYDALLASIAGLTFGSDSYIYGTGSNTAAAGTITSYGRSVVAVANEAAFKSLVNLEIGTDVQAYGATLTSLEGLSLAQGDILYATAADTLARLPKGTASQVLRMNSGATAPEWATASTSGKVAQIVSNISTTANSIGSTIPLDNTTPQITEGESIVTQAITPTNASSTLLIEVSVPILVFALPAGGSEPEAVAITALFVQGTANALAAVAGPRARAHDSGTSTGPSAYVAEGVAVIRHTLTAGSTSARTYEVRVGHNGTNSVTVNGTATLGGTRGARITITEYLP